MAERSKATHSNAGFTLIEITIAVFLLATALTIILGLQTSSVSRSINDQNRLNAMLLARRLLTKLEIGEVEVKPQEISVPALEYLPKEDIVPAEEKSLQNFTVNLKIEPWTIPNYDDVKVNRILLNIDWGEASDQSLSIYYFISQGDEVG